jgi:formylglycine-generating enzyme required for sulfatase activity
VCSDGTEVASTHQGALLPPMRLAPGTMLSVYRVEDVIGEGGMGVVYRARDTAADRTVALKCLHTNLAGDPVVRQRFLREARVLRVWSHPGAVAIHDFVEHAHLLAIVMELVAGESLARHLARWRGRMPLAEIRTILGDVLEAMQDAHDHGVVHRDLKPDNILVKDDGGRLRPKIVDFGIAKMLEGTTYTVSGALLGTCMYMAPEQVKTPSATDHRADVYSLGVTLYELVTGKPPFDGDGNHFAAMMAHVTQRPRPPSKLRKDTPPELEKLILDALAKSPDDRPQSCAAFRERLFDAIADAPRSVASASVSQPPLAETITDTLGQELVLVPAGPFAMGPGRREIVLDAFYMDRTPVTNEQFARFVRATGYEPDDGGGSSGGGAKGRYLQHWRGDRPARGEDKHPVTYVSWTDARAYAAWAGKRLPTEAEWEKAARGTDGRKYPWGRAEPGPSHASFGNARRGPMPVGSFPDGASPFGLLDMAGNVWEWCEDVFDDDFYASGPSHNPRLTAPSKRSLLVMRGGSWMYDASSLRTFARTGFEAHYRFAGGGFRCARTP